MQFLDLILELEEKKVKNKSLLLSTGEWRTYVAASLKAADVVEFDLGAGVMCLVPAHEIVSVDYKLPSAA